MDTFTNLLICAAIGFFGTWAFLKFIWEPSRTEHLKAQTTIRSLEWRKKQIEAGINPDGLPYDYDRSCDFHNYNCQCDKCKRVSKENDERVKRDIAIKNKLLEGEK